jgi:hypothetical protein
MRRRGLAICFAFLGALSDDNEVVQDPFVAAPVAVRVRAAHKVVVVAVVATAAAAARAVWISWEARNLHF